jgi:hypothetical protein
MGPMSTNARSVAPDPTSSEQRRLPRKTALLNGVLSDLTGETASDCTIQDINARGAAIGIRGKLPIGAQVYLLDGNGAAHLSRVVWSNADRSGLLFVQSYAMGFGLPPRMRFLWRLLLEGKLRQVDRAVAMGIDAELALSTVGLTREYVHQLAQFAGADKRFQRLLLRAGRLLEE